MKTVLVIFISIFSMMLTNENDKTIYEFKHKALLGNEVEMSEFEGDVLLIVNTASECGYTPQYEGLQAIYEKYSDQGFQVLGFPANNFGGQEPGSDDEIAEFCEVTFGIEFPMFSKVSVKGADIDPMFEYLTTTENSDFTGDIGWNFEKFLIDRDGNLIRRFKSDTEPESEVLAVAIEEAIQS